MRPFSFQFTIARRYALVLWLAVLLPMAQAAANWHVLSHASAGVSEPADDQSALHQVHCDLCLIAAAVSSGAPASEPPGVFEAAVHHDLPQAAPLSSWVALPAWPYQSRAPPVFSS